MASLIGTHNRTNGIKQIPSRVVFSLNGVGLGSDETHPDTVTIVRDTRVFPAGETTPDFNTFEPSTAVTWADYGRYWWKERTENGGNFRTAWALNPADYYAIQNERGGNDPWAIQRMVDIERAISWAAGADGVKCCVLNLAGGTPGDFELWKSICAPFIVEAWETWGHIYGRHCYADWFVEDDGSINNGQPQRVINELEYLKSIDYGGGMVLTECGLYGGYGVADYDYFEQQVTRWEAALRPYADIFIGLAWWETGASEFEADYTDHLKQLLPYIQAGNLPRWAPSTTPPPDGGEGSMTIWKNAIRHHVHYLDISHVKLAFFKETEVTDGTGKKHFSSQYLGASDLIEVPSGADIVSLVEFSPEDETTDPNPPPVVLTLPRGSKGVDLSNYQAGFFDVVSPADFDFYIFRCSDGMNTSATSNNHDANGVDKALWEFADVGHVSMRPWGIYHFLRPGNVQGQVNKVLGILQALKERGTPPRTAVFDNGVKLPAVWIDVEDGALTSAQVQEFYNLVAAGHHTGIYTGKPIWESITSGASVWWSDVPLWIAAYGVNDGTVPNWPDGPFLPRGYVEAVVWQYSSDPIDQNIVGPYPPTATQPPPPPPTGETVDTLPYFQPSGQFGRYVVFHFTDGRTQPQQMEKIPDGRTILWKGEGQNIDGKMVYDYEEILVDDEGVKKFKDTSSGGRAAYDLDGVIWLPRIVEIGKVYPSSPTVREFDRVTCQTTASNQTTDYIYVKELLPVWTSPIDPSITFPKVLVCEWRKTPDITTPPIEIYGIAPDTCYVFWQDGAVGELPEGRQPLSFDLTDCG